MKKPLNECAPDTVALNTVICLTLKAVADTLHSPRPPQSLPDFCSALVGSIANAFPLSALKELQANAPDLDEFSGEKMAGRVARAVSLTIDGVIAKKELALP